MEKLEITQEEKNEITAALQIIYDIAAKNPKTGIVEQVVKINEILEIEIIF